MSRSYKKTPINKTVVDKKAKSFANRAVRRFKGSIPNGNAYKRIYSSWDIYDAVFYYSYQAFQKDEEARKKNNTNGIFRSFYYPKRRDFWERYYYRK